MNNLRLTVPEPQIKLYEQGFEGVCKLGRASDGQKLSDLVERIAEPMVIALDAPWGAGKSVFLKCWVGEHAKLDKATTVYFDAFKHDYMDDPLVSIVGALDERVSSLPEPVKEGSKFAEGMKSLKKYAPAVGRGLLRMGVSVATAGVITNIDNHSETLWDEVADAGGKELGTLTKEFWKAEEIRRHAMDAFRETLRSIATPEQKLVIVVDELDRCRPDYALNLLEVIKHFFDVPNVHFVLGVNLKELANSVKARYGAGVNAEKYLQKFVTLSMPLTARSRFRPTNDAAQKHLEYCASELGFGYTGKSEALANYVGLVELHVGLSLRDVEKVATLAKVTSPPQFPQWLDGHFHLFYGLLILKVIAPEFIDKVRSRNTSREDLFDIFNVQHRADDNTFSATAHDSWLLATSNRASEIPTNLSGSSERLFGNEPPPEVLRSLVTNNIDAFDFYG